MEQMHSNQEQAFRQPWKNCGGKRSAATLPSFNRGQATILKPGTLGKGVQGPFPSVFMARAFLLNSSANMLQCSWKNSPLAVQQAAGHRFLGPSDALAKSRAGKFDGSPG